MLLGHDASRQARWQVRPVWPGTARAQLTSSCAAPRPGPRTCARDGHVLEAASTPCTCQSLLQCSIPLCCSAPQGHGSRLLSVYATVPKAVESPRREPIEHACRCNRLHTLHDHTHKCKRLQRCVPYDVSADGCPGAGRVIGSSAQRTGAGAGESVGERGMRVKRASAAAVPPREHAVSVWCETDIFEAVGLAYVPPHMRHFHGVSS